ncbi:hypothetical protein D9M68_780150 [compost metagenome]
MNDQGSGVEFRGHGRSVESAGCRTDEHQALDVARRVQPNGRVTGDECPEREASQKQRAFGGMGGDHGQQIIELAPAFVVHALAGTHPPEVEPHRSQTRQHTGPSQRLHHFVGQRAAMQRMRMRDHRHASRGKLGPVNGQLNLPRRARHRQDFRLGVHAPASGSGFTT